MKTILSLILLLAVSASAQPIDAQIELKKSLEAYTESIIDWNARMLFVPDGWPKPLPDETVREYESRMLHILSATNGPADGLGIYQTITNADQPQWTDFSLVTITNWTGYTFQDRELGYEATNHIATIYYQDVTNVTVLKTVSSDKAVWREPPKITCLTNSFETTTTNIYYYWDGTPATNWMEIEKFIRGAQ
jgi:hypothetical protein